MILILTIMWTASSLHSHTIIQHYSLLADPLIKKLLASSDILVMKVLNSFSFIDLFFQKNSLSENLKQSDTHKKVKMQK